MPSNITDSDTFTTTVQAPNDGETANAASLITTFVQALANRTKWLYNRLTGTSVLALLGTLTLQDEDVDIEEDLLVGGDVDIAGALDVAGIMTAGTVVGPLQQIAAARVSITGTSVADGSILTLGGLSQFVVGGGAFSLASNELTVPSTGTYLVIVSMDVETGPTAKIGTDLELNSSALVTHTQDYDAASSTVAIQSYHHVFQITNAAHKISLRSTDSNLSIIGTSSRMTVVRLYTAGLA